jgi:hypothetical protein
MNLLNRSREPDTVAVSGIENTPLDGATVLVDDADGAGDGESVLAVVALTGGVTAVAVPAVRFVNVVPVWLLSACSVRRNAGIPLVLGRAS